MSHTWKIGGHPSSNENKDAADRTDVRPWPPGTTSSPVIRSPQFMLGGRLATIREPHFMRLVLPRNIDPVLKHREPVNRRSEDKIDGK